jgi:hypothetical protein
MRNLRRYAVLNKKEVMAMLATVNKDRRAKMPAKIPVPQTSYSGRFAERLRTLRAGRDVDKILAAIERAGFKRCSKATYYNWEGGVTDPPIEALPALAKALGVTVPEMFPTR